MKPQTLIIGALLSFGCKANAQQAPFVVSSAGGTNNTSNIQLEWTLGEPVVESNTTISKLITQGFHQPLIIIESKAANEFTPGVLVTASVYPNPVQSVLNVKVSDITKASISLANLQGHVLFSEQVTSKNSSIQINMNPFPPSVYVLYVKDVTGKILNTYKIIKFK